MSELRELIEAMHPDLARLLAQVPDAIQDAVASRHARQFLENLILKHGVLLGGAIESRPLTLVFFPDADSPEEAVDRFREFFAEAIVDQGEDELIEELIERGVRNLEASGEMIEDVDPQ